MAAKPLTQAEVDRMLEQKRLELQLEERLEAEVEKHMSKTARKLMMRTEERLTDKMKARRDRFVSCYVRHFIGPLAVIESGGAVTTASKMSSEFLREPYVRQKINEVIRSLKESELLDRKQILAGFLREAHYEGHGASHGARVQAWKSLADIAGMEAPKTVKNEHSVKGGVMVVPMAGSVDDWEKAAQESQTALKSDVRT